MVSPTAPSWVRSLPNGARADLRAHFARRGYAELSRALDPALFGRLRELTEAAFAGFGRRRDFIMPATGNSPRSYTLVPREGLVAQGACIPALYRDATLLALIEDVAGVPVRPVPYVPEEFIAARYERAGDTHGWHWDDYAFALVLVLEAPDESGGGSLEFLRGVPWDKARPDVERHVREGRVERFHPRANTAYLLRTDTTLHRVTPLTRPAHREILCLSYAAPEDFARDITHETLEALAG